MPRNCGASKLNSKRTRGICESCYWSFCISLTPMIFESVRNFL